jgi:transposase
MSKHIELHIEDDRFTFARKVAQIAAEAALDGIDVLRTNVDAQTLDTADVIRSYKQLARVERAFRDMKSDDLQIRPIHHRLEERVRFGLALAEPICLPASAKPSRCTSRMRA